MAIFPANLIAILLICNSVFCSEVFEVLNEVEHCFKADVEPCLVNHAVGALLEATDLGDISNVTKAIQNDSATVEESLFSQLREAIKDSAYRIEPRGRQDSMLRTFNRAWKYLIPMLIGVKLKLATFVPMVLTVLTIIAKSAFLSGNMALLLTGLNIALKYWYPKWSSEENSGHAAHSYHGDYHSYNAHGQYYNFPYNGYRGMGSPGHLNQALQMQ